MTPKQHKNLEAMGGRITTVEEFLGLSPSQMWLIDLKIDLGEAIRQHRITRDWTQIQFAKMLGISQPRVANLEAGGPSISLDVQLVALKVLGVTVAQLGEVLEPNFATRENEESNNRELMAA